MSSIQDINAVYYKAGVSYDTPTKVWSKPSGTDGYDSAFFSSHYINAPYQDQSVRWKVIEANKRRMAGFASRARSRPDLSGEFMIEVTETGVIRVVESGTVVATYGTTATVDDELRVQIIFQSPNYVVKYWWRNDEFSAEQLIYTSVITSANITNKFPLHTKAEFYSVGATEKNVTMEVTEAGTNQIAYIGDMVSSDSNLNNEHTIVLKTYQERIDTNNVSALVFFSISNNEGNQNNCPSPTEGQLFPLGDGFNL